MKNALIAATLFILSLLGAPAHASEILKGEGIQLLVTLDELECLNALPSEDAYRDCRLKTVVKQYESPLPYVSCSVYEKKLAYLEANKLLRKEGYNRWNVVRPTKEWEKAHHLNAHYRHEFISAKDWKVMEIACNPDKMQGLAQEWANQKIDRELVALKRFFP